MTLIRTALAAAILALVAASSANAHEYYRLGPDIAQTNQWDVRLPAPYSRDEFDRFTQ
jgi:hypothetical protein